MTLLEHARDSAPANPRPAFAQPRLIPYVFLGGALGTAGREGIALALPRSGSGIPWAVLIANLCGAFILGFLLTALARRGPETHAIRDVRLFAGTGMMGGFTTYSSLATDTATLFENDPGLAVVYGLLSVAAGLALVALGVWLGGRLPRRGAQAEAAT